MAAQNGLSSEAVAQLDAGDAEFRRQFVSWNLGELTAPDIRAYLDVKDIVLVPLASTEQHGLHLPLCTDVITAMGVAERVAELAGVLHTPAIWTGYSPQHMFRPGQGRGTITVRASTLGALVSDVVRSLVHHGFNKVIIVNGHGSNEKVIDPVMRQVRYDTGALVGFVNCLMERYVGIFENLMENPPQETPGSHASELETSQDLAQIPDLVRLDRFEKTDVHAPDFLPSVFSKSDGRNDVTFEGFTYFSFPMEYSEITRDGATGNALNATAEKGVEAFERLSAHIARGVVELTGAPSTVHSREFVGRAM